MVSARIVALSLLLSVATICQGQSPATVDFAALLRVPDKEEIAATRKFIRQRPQVITNVRVVQRATYQLGNQPYQARLVEHALNGVKHCGVVLVPQSAKRKSLAGLVDAPDVRWDYPPRDITRGLYVTRILGEHSADFAVILPCLRGGAIRIGETLLQAAGDRRDAMDGAAEDAIAFARAALTVAPEIDPARLAVYGYSRGGGVALLAGSRNKLFKVVLAFAAPTDFFRAMNRPGDNWAESLSKAYRDRNLAADTREAQQLEWFVRGREHLPLWEKRRRIIASSPLYFASNLPATQAFFGEADRPVPVANALALKEALGRQGAKLGSAVHIYKGAGHMLDETPAHGEARSFLWKRVGASSRAK